MSEQAQRVAHCLQVTLEPDQARRAAAEQQLVAEDAQPGFGTALVQIVTSQEVPAHLRQLAAVLLKQHIRRHWVEGDDKFQPPETSEAEKQFIRQQLPAGLADSDSRVRTAVGMAVAAIASWDWPQAWPDLMGNIIGSIRSKQDTNLVAGCLQCLSVMGSDLDEEQKPELMQVLAPELHTILAATTPAAAAPVPPGSLPAAAAPGLAAAGVGSSCLAIMGELVGGLGALSGAHQKRVRAMMAGQLGPWLEALGGVLGVAVDMEHRHYWGCQLEALKLLQLLLTYFSGTMGDAVTPLLGATWGMLTSGQTAYLSLVVGNEEGEVEGDGEEGAVLEGLMAQLFELLLCVVERPRYRPLFEPVLQQLAAVALPYMVPTADQVTSWADNPEQYLVEDELEGASPRTSAEMLLEDMVREWGPAAAGALLGAVAGAWGRAGWKWREAGLQALGGCSEVLIEVLEEGGPHQGPLSAQLLALLQDALTRDLLPLTQPHPPPAPSAGGGGGGGGEGAEVGALLLQGRALWAVSRYGRLLGREQQEVLLQAAALSLSPSAPLLVVVGASRALAALLPVLPPASLVPLLPGLLGRGGALLQLLNNCQEEVLHLVLELITELLAAGGGAAEAAAADAGLELVGGVLQVWERHVADPLLSEDALDLLSRLAATPALLPTLAAHTLGPLTATLARGAGEAGGGGGGGGGVGGQQQQQQQQAPVLVEASCDLLATLVQPGQGEVAASVARAALSLALQLAGRSDDDAQVAAAVRLLVKLMRVLGQDLPSCAAPGSPPDALLQQLLALALHLLSPNLPDTLSRPGAPLVLQLLRSYPAASASFLPALLPALVTKVASPGSSPVLIAELLVVVTVLARTDAGQLVNMLAGLTCSLPDGSTGNGLSALLPLLCRHAGDVVGELRTKQVAAALLALLEQRGHPALVSLSVASDEVEAAAGEGRRTRSQARQAGGLRFKQVPVSLRLLGVLGELVAGEVEGRGRGWAGGGSEEEEEEEDEEGWEEEGEEGGKEQENVDVNGGGLALGGGLVVTGDGSVVAKGVGGKAGGGRGLGSLQVPGEEWGDLLEGSTVAGTPGAGCGEEVDPEDARDPLMGVPLRQVVRQGLAGLAAGGGKELLQAAVGQLAPREVAALQPLLP